MIKMARWLLWIPTSLFFNKKSIPFLWQDNGNLSLSIPSHTHTRSLSTLFWVLLIIFDTILKLLSEWLLLRFVVNLSVQKMKLKFLTIWNWLEPLEFWINFVQLPKTLWMMYDLESDFDFLYFLLLIKSYTQNNNQTIFFLLICFFSWKERVFKRWWSRETRKRLPLLWPSRFHYKISHSISTFEKLRIWISLFLWMMMLWCFCEGGIVRKRYYWRVQSVCDNLPRFEKTHWCAIDHSSSTSSNRCTVRF